MNDRCFSTKTSLWGMSLLVRDTRFGTEVYWGGRSARWGDNFQKQCDDIAAKDLDENWCSE